MPLSPASIGIFEVCNAGLYLVTPVFTPSLVEANYRSPEDLAVTTRPLDPKRSLRSLREPFCQVGLSEVSYVQKT